MPITQVRAPSGDLISVKHPEGATQAEIIGYARAQVMERPELRSGEQKYAEQAAKSSAIENAAAAFGGALPAGIRLGVRQMVGKAGPDEVKDWADSMRGLTSTTGGKVGAVLGGAAPAVAASMLPGGQTVLGAALYGGIDGMLQPVQEGQSRVGNAVSGAAWNSAFPAALAVGNATRAVSAPLRKGGREGIAGRVLERFATDPASVDRAAGQLRTASGAVPTLAEATGDLGIANLQRTLQSQDPRGLIAGRYAENNAARVGALQRLGGTDQELAASLARRRAIGGSAYDRASVSGLDTLAADALRPKITSLMERDEVRKAVQEARSLAKSEGHALDDMAGSVAGLQYTKQALDDMISNLGPKEANKRRIWGKTSAELKQVMDEVSPDLRRADRIYERLSREPNRMETARAVTNDATAALKDSATGSPALYSNQFAKLLNNGAEKQVKSATGLSRRPLDQIMSAEQMALLNGLKTEVERQTSAQATRLPGSPTAKYLAGQDLIGRIAGPLGVPKSMVQNTLVENFLARPTTWALKSSEEQLNETLLRGMLDPAFAANLAKKGKPSATERGLLKAIERASPLLQGGALGYGLLDAPQ